MSKVTKYICDSCEVEIMETDIDKSKTVIDASVYGVHLHTKCFKSLIPWRFISILGLDDITIGGDKLIHAAVYRDVPI